MYANPFEEILTRLEAIEEKISPPTSPNAPIEIIDRPELKKRLNLTEPTVIRYGQRGVIPEIRVGARVMYNWPSVIAALEASKK